MQRAGVAGLGAEGDERGGGALRQSGLGQCSLPPRVPTAEAKGVAD